MKKGKVYIGWEKVDITPKKKVLICGQFSPRISKEVVSPLTATVLAIETRDGKGKSIDHAVMVSCDLSMIFFKKQLEKKLKKLLPDFNPGKLTLNATHTHTACAVERGWYPEPENDPDFMDPDEYIELLLDRLSKAIVKAWKSRKPGGVSRGFDHAAVGHNRRAVYADGSSRMYGKTDQDDFIGIEGFEDHSVNMLFTWNASGKLTGIVVNLACPSQVDESGKYLSADFWHEVRLEFADSFTSKVHLLPQCAAAGDQSPHFIVNKKEEADMRQRRNLTEKQVIAKKIMFAVNSAYDAAKNSIENSMVLAHMSKSYRLPLRKVTKKEYEREKKMIADGGKPWPFGPICNLIERYKNQKKVKNMTFEYHIIRVGDMVFATNPFELFTDFGICMKARSAARQTFIVQLADATGFYLPTEKAVKGGHYSAVIKSNWIGPEGGRILVDRTVKDISKLFPIGS